MKFCSKLDLIPPYMFSKLDKLKNEMLSKGYDIIDLSVGDPDLPTPDFIIKAMAEACKDPKNHRYPPYEGTYEFRKAVGDYYKRRFGVELDIDHEIVALIGSKEGIAHMSYALIDRGDVGLIPDPGYPVYKTSVCLAGGIPYVIPLTIEHNFLPNLESIDKTVAKKAKLMFVNYPNNPTGVVCSSEYLQSIVDFGRKNDIVICNDAAYNEIVFDDNRPMSIMAIHGAKDICVEFGTLSKSYNMTGWRIGYAVGNREILKKLMIIKTNTDSGQFAAIQHAGAVALDYGDSHIDYMRKIYKDRRDYALSLFHKIRMDIIKPGGSFYLWFKTPNKYSSKKFTEVLMEKCGIIVTPGSAFGEFGEGYCRIALTTHKEAFNKAMTRISERFFN